jgi:hypothetical protein
MSDFGLRRIIMRGKVIRTAIAVEDIMVTVTTVGIGLMNSPIIPVVRRSGTNDQMVVTVVDPDGDYRIAPNEKSGLCGSEFAGFVVGSHGETTTIVSSIRRPSARRNAKSVRKLIDCPNIFMKKNADRNVSGTLNEEYDRLTQPRNMKRHPMIRRMVDRNSPKRSEN